MSLDFEHAVNSIHSDIDRYCVFLIVSLPEKAERRFTASQLLFTSSINHLSTFLTVLFDFEYVCTNTPPLTSHEKSIYIVHTQACTPASSPVSVYRTFFPHCLKVVYSWLVIVVTEKCLLSVYTSLRVYCGTALSQ